MVAAQAYIDRATTHAERVRRVQLEVAPLSEHKGIPEDVRTAVDAILKMIDDRILRPVVEAPTIEEANARALGGFEGFVDLWPAAISALLPWLQSHPEQFRKLTGAARGMWRSDQAILTLGEAACEWFGAAQSARNALTSATPGDADADAIMKYTLLADFALALGTFMIKNPGTKAVEGLPLMVAQLAHDSATNAFALATRHAYADSTP